MIVVWTIIGVVIFFALAIVTIGLAREPRDQAALLRRRASKHKSAGCDICSAKGWDK